MRKLYTDVSLETPFMVSYNDVQTQACANDEDTVTIGATEFIRLTDENGHNVSDREGNQLLLDDGVVYKVVSGVPESTNVQVTDVTPEPPVVRHTYTYNLSNDETASFTCSDEGATITSNAVTAAEGAIITFSFSRTGYQTLSGTTTMGSNDEYATIDLVREGYVPAWTSSELATTVYTINYPPQLGDSVHDGLFTSIDVVGEIETTAGIVTAIKPSEEEYSGTYYRNSYSDMANPQIAVITVVPWPEDATVTLTAQGFTQQGNSISVDVGTQVSCQVTREGFIGSQQTINADETKAVSVILDGYSLVNPLDSTLCYDPNESLDNYWLYYGADGTVGQVALYNMTGEITKYAQIRLSETPITMDNTNYYPVIANSGSELYPSHYTLYVPQGYDHPRVLMVTSSLDSFYAWDVGAAYPPDICLDFSLVIREGGPEPEGN